MEPRKAFFSLYCHIRCSCCTLHNTHWSFHPSRIIANFTLGRGKDFLLIKCTRSTSHKARGVGGMQDQFNGEEKVTKCLAKVSGESCSYSFELVLTGPRTFLTTTMSTTMSTMMMIGEETIRVLDIFERCPCHIPTFQVGRQTPGRLLIVINDYCDLQKGDLVMCYDSWCQVCLDLTHSTNLNFAQNSYSVPVLDMIIFLIKWSKGSDADSPEKSFSCSAIILIGLRCCYL